MMVLCFCIQVNPTRKDSQSSDAPTIQINDIELNIKSAPINGTLHNSVGDHYNSSSTLVSMEGHSPIGSRSSTPVAHITSNGDPGDSGFGMEDVGSDSVEHHKVSRMSPSHDNELSARLSVASDSDYSVSSRSNLSDMDDTTEMSYFKNIADLNANSSPVVKRFAHVNDSKVPVIILESVIDSFADERLLAYPIYWDFIFPCLLTLGSCLGEGILLFT